MILFDGRGTGLSDPIVGDRLPSLEERIDDIRAVLDATEAERVVLVSFADAGPLCCLFAASHPERTRGLVLCNTTPRTAWAPDHPWGMTPEEFRDRLAAIESRWGTRDYAAEIVRSAAPSHADDDVMIDWWARSMRMSAAPAAAANLLRMYYEMDVREVLPTIHAPTLVLSSEGVREEAAAMAARIPGAIHHVIPGQDPTVMANPVPYIEEIRGFVTRLADEEADLDRVLATVLFTDVVDSTQRVTELGDRAWRALIEKHHAFVRGVIARWRGREVDTAGDGFFASFDGPARAIRAARSIVEGTAALGLRVRAGLHTGECERIDGKIGGLAVVIGSRIAGTAGGGEVLVSQTVKDLVAGCGFEFADAGEHELKGVPGAWRLYRVE